MRFRSASHIINPYLCLVFHAVLAIYYAFDPISRRVALEGNP